MTDLESLIILNRLCSPQKALRLIAQYGCAQVAAKSLNKEGVIEFCDKDLECAEKAHVKIISYFDDRYPQCLKVISDPPLLLYIKGDLNKDEQAIGIVGTRVCSQYGKEMAAKFAAELAANGFTIVSGLARGIDTCAHLGALKTGRTIAVLGSGIGEVYPKENRELALRIAENGALISEYPMMCTPEKHFFPRRNRIVSALAQGMLLIEAPLKSGAMITMEIAQIQNKICFAMPGPIDREGFQGNHFLIKRGKANLVENTQDVVSLLNPGSTSSTYNLENKPDLDPEELLLIKNLPSEEVSFEEISLRVNLPTAKLNYLLMSLVLKQAVVEYPGKFYKKTLWGIR